MNFDLRVYNECYWEEEMLDDNEYLTYNDVNSLIKDSHFSFEDCYYDLDKDLDEEPF